MLKKSFHLLAVLALLFLMTPQKTSAAVLNWEAMVNSTQTGVRSPGFGDENNVFVSSMTAFNDYLYVATYNDNRGTEIWRTNNGTAWTQVNNDGFGDYATSVAVLGVFKNQLYAFRTMPDPAGVKVFRTSNGTDWETATDSLGANLNLTTATVYNNIFYVGADNTVSNEVAVFGSSDGSTWIQMNVDGFGDVNNIIIQSMTTFNNSLYVGVYNDIDGTEIWQYDGANWVQDNTSGFDDNNNLGTGGLAVLDGKLFAITSNDTSGCEVWRTTGNQVWNRVLDTGFGQAGAINLAYDLITFQGAMYAGVSGARVFRSTDGGTWEQVNATGFGFADNEPVIFGILGDYIYAGVGTVPAVVPLPATVEIYRFYGVPTVSTVSEPEVLPQTGPSI